MRSVLVSFGLLSVFMLVSSLPLGPATLEKRQFPGSSDDRLSVISGVLGGFGGNYGAGDSDGTGDNGAGGPTP